MAAAQQAFIKLSRSRVSQSGDTHHSLDGAVEEIEKKALWLKTKLKEGPIDGPTGVKTYREDIRQILFRAFNSPISDLEIGVVVRKAFPKHSRKGKYYFGIGARNAKYADEAGRTIATDNPKSLMTIQSDGGSRETSPVMLKPVKKRAIQAWKETQNGQAFAADQMIRDANSQPSTPVVSVAPNDGLVRPQWRPMLMLPQHLHMAPRGMLFPAGRLPPGALPMPHPIMPTSEPNNNINRHLAPSSRSRKRSTVDMGTLQKLSYGADHRGIGKKPRKEGAMIELSSSHNGLVAERNSLAGVHIEPIILDFEVSLPKLPLSSSASASSGSASALLGRGTASEMQASKEQSQSGEMPKTPKDKMPVSPRPGEAAESAHSKLVNKSESSSESKKATGEQSSKPADSTSCDPFKKPDIEDYRSNVSAGRCLLCQNPIPPNGNSDASPQDSASLSICIKCKKVAMSGAKSFKPVPKFPYACNPKLAPKTVYVPPPRRLYKPKPPLPKGPQKAVGIRLYPPRSRSTSSCSSRSSVSACASPRSPGQLSVPGSPAPSLPLGSPQPCSPGLIMHSAPPSPRHASDAGVKMQSLSLPPSPSMISQHPSSPLAADARELEASRRHMPTASLQVPSPSYSSSPSTPGGRDSVSSERLALPPGREQDDATIKALLQLGRGVERTPSEYSADSTPVPSPINRTPERDTVLQPYPTSSVSVPHLPISLPLLAGQVPMSMIPSNAGVVMGPQGQLLPIIPSWPPMGVPTSEAMNMMSAAGFPPMPLLIQPPSTRETSSPTVASPAPVTPSVKSRNPPDPAKTSAGPTTDSYSYDISQMKYRKALKRCRASEGMTDSSTDCVSYRADSTQEDKSKSKQPIVIVGTNCAGSSSIKLNKDKEAPYHQEEVTREAPEMYGKPFSAFCCRCSGREIMLLQCTDCDFVCNNKFGMELHIAAQRHAESRSKTSIPEVLPAHANDTEDRDDIASQSSVETQSADTDTDAASPPPKRVLKEVPWTRVPETAGQLALPPWHEGLHFMPVQSVSQEPFPSRTNQNSFVATSTFGSLGMMTEKTVPLDLSGRTFPPSPYLQGMPPSSFLWKEQRREGSLEESSPLDLSGHGRPPVMSTGGSGMNPFLSSSKPGTQGSFTSKRTPLDVASSQQPLAAPNLVLTTSNSKKTLQPAVPQTFFDLMRLHDMPIPSTAATSVNISKSLQSSAKIPSARPLTGSSLSVSKAHLESPSSPKSYPLIPSIVLSSNTSTAPSVPKPYPYPTTELTRPPPGVITPILSQQQSLNYQGGIISIRPTIPVPQMLVSSKTVPVLSPFPLPASVSASMSETRTSPCRDFSAMESLNVSVGSPYLQTGSPNRGSPSVRDSPQARQRYGALDSPREHTGRKDPSPQRSPQPVHIKIEPPDTPHEVEHSGSGNPKQRWLDETEKQARLLEASLIGEPTRPSRSRGFLGGSDGIGRTSWAISSRSLQIRDNTYVNTTASLPRALHTGPEGPLSRNSPDRDSYNGARLSSGAMHRTNASSRDSSQTSSPTAGTYPERSGEMSRDPSFHSDSLNSSSPNTSRKDSLSDRRSREDQGVEATQLDTEAGNPTALHIKLEKPTRD